MIFALIGNQNCGKTMLFNQLTGENQHVGNFPGVTIEKTGSIVKDFPDCQVVDLPGIYSMHSYSAMDRITRDFLLSGQPDVLINLVDAGNIERNLYLTLQLLELQLPMVVAHNMMDELIGNGGSVDVAGLSDKLGVPVVPISAIHREGIHELLEIVMETGRQRRKPRVQDFCFDGPIHRCIHAVSHVIEDHADRIGVPSRFAATRLVDGDEEIAEKLELNQNEMELIEHSVLEMETERGLDRNAALAHMRYMFIENICRETVHKPEESREHHRSIRIDNILTHKYFGVPVFLCIMGIIFWLTFGAVGTWSDFLARALDWLIAKSDAAMTAYGLNPVVQSLCIDGVFAGVGTVLSFLPRIVILFFFLSILEDTGYMARVAFVMDKLLRKMGLSGRSFVPMLIGFGCTVPAIMATRTLSSNRDRKMTILLMPFMSCSAKIPIYAVFSAAFFPSHQVLTMISLYVGGMVIAVLAACILNHTAFHGKPIPFVMELPNYRWPTAKSVLLLVWEKVRDFLMNAFTVIFLATLVIWFLQTFDTRLNVVAEGGVSLLALAGQYITPIFAPLGFGDWKIVTALMNGLLAKEAVVSSLGVLMNCSIAELSSVLPTLFTTASAVSFMTFCLLYTPCVAAIAAIRREIGSAAKTLLIVLSQCMIAWGIAFLVYRTLCAWQG